MQNSNAEQHQRTMNEAPRVSSTEYHVKLTTGNQPSEAMAGEQVARYAALASELGLRVEEVRVVR